MILKDIIEDMCLYKENGKKEIVFMVNNSIIYDNIVHEIIKHSSSKKRIGLDMSKVESIQSKKFMKYLKENKFELFNLKNELLAYLSLVFDGGFLKTFTNKQDFIENKREFLIRHFLVD